MVRLFNFSKFFLEATLYSPMIYSFALIGAIGDPSGDENHAVRTGIAQNFLVARGPVTFRSILNFLPDSSVEGGHLLSIQRLNIGPVRAEMLTQYGWTALARIAHPLYVFVRPELAVTIWKSFGIFTQFEMDTELDYKTFRVGAELTAAF